MRPPTGPRSARDGRFAPWAQSARVPAWWVAAVLAAAYLVIDPPSADLAAQAYRVRLFREHGALLWDNGWYAGHHVPGYSVLFPPLGALLGPRVAGAVAVVAAVWAFGRLLRGRVAPRTARVASLWWATSAATLLVTGRLTFALGAALAVGAVWAAAAGRPRTAAGVGVLAALASPVAAVFLALVLAAWWWTRREVALLVVAGVALVPVAVLGLAFPEGGDFPFVASSFWPALAGVALLGVLARDDRVLRPGLLLYGLLLIAAFALPTPMGGNAVRLGALLAGPVAVCALLAQRPRVVLALVPVVTYWAWSAPVDDWHRAAGDPSVHAPYYRGLIGFLRAQPGPLRVEVPFTDNHWESARLAPSVPLARGWERQLDRKVNGLFYDDTGPTPARYERWLRDTGVAFVALADAPVDYSAAAEAQLVRDGQPFLRPVWRDAHWRVFAVRGARGLADGARVTALRPDGFTVRGRPGTRALVRVRWTPYWRARGGCAGRAGAWTRVRVGRTGRTDVDARLSLRGLLHRERRCR